MCQREKENKSEEDEEIVLKMEEQSGRVFIMQNYEEREEDRQERQVHGARVWVMFL